MKTFIVNFITFLITIGILQILIVINHHLSYHHFNPDVQLLIIIVLSYIIFKIVFTINEIIINEY